MSSPFNQTRESNFFDRLAVDVSRLFADFPVTRKAELRSRRTQFSRLYANPLLPLKYRGYAARLLRQANLDLGWFYEFSDYWTMILRGRPLWSVYDFHFLKNVYRMQFQDSQVPDTASAVEHLQAWQRPELLYQLFHCVGKESIMGQFSTLLHLRHLGRRPRAMLEFGCAIGSISHFFLDFFARARDVRLYMADIQTIAFHYGAYRLRACPNVTPVLLAPEKDFQIDLDERLDVVFCIAVFEHLNRPAETARRFHDLLNPGGLLIFDYVKAQGEGLDTRQGADERGSVLDFITANFEPVVGKIAADQNVGLTVVRKR